MKRVLIPTDGASDWRRFLAEPDKQWKRGASAMELAVSWELAQTSHRGLPPEVADVLDSHSSLAGAWLLAALPEHKVALKGRGKPSQTDVWALLRADSGLISMAVEGKAGEPFGEWLKEASEGKKEGFNYLCEILEASDVPAAELRYQLYHRTASAVIEAQRFGAPFAVMLVQSFHEDSLSWNDYCAFCSLLGATAVRGSLVEARGKGSERLFLGWVDSKVASDSEFSRAI